MSSAEIYVVSAVRSAIGGFGGSLKDLPLADLATAVTRAAIERAGVDAGQIGHMVMGSVIPTEPRDAYLARVPAQQLQWPDGAAAVADRFLAAGRAEEALAILDQAAQAAKAAENAPKQESPADAKDGEVVDAEFAETK